MPAMRRLVIAAVALAHGAAVAHAEPNPHLAEARRAKAELRYADALAAVDAALRWGRNAPDQMMEIYRLEGELAAGLDDPARATEAFARLLALDPDAALAAGTSPKLTAPFAAARGRGALRVHHETVGGERPRAVLVVDGDPLGMVAGARVRAGGAVTEGRGATRIELPVAAGAAFSIAAIDEHGNELAAFTDLRAPAAPTTPLPAPDPVLEPPVVATGGDHPAWPYVAGLALVLAGGGTYFALDSRSAQREFDELKDSSDEHEASRALALEERGERSATLANVGFATAGVAAVAATWLYIRSRRDPETTVAVTPAPGGAHVTASWSF